ncbi:transglycosylase [Acinetobacter celticus]|uniref:Transglycosylase n=1 Tax=Acinetobacter celticus TaxID=1891224 RepID=A0A1C3CTK6_9GAMM|nr:transglycosylase [Acinetobacter celticus]
MQSITLRTISVLFTVCLFTGCSSLGGGSVQKRSAKLSNGIQKAYSVSPTTANRISPLIVQSADQYNLDPLMLAALIRQESTYRSQVVSSAGAVGLTQVMPRYWQKTCPGDLYDEATNINCGSFILTKYEQSAGSLKKALGYYNVGPSNFENNHKMRKQGKRYAKQVKAHEKNLKNAI